MIKKIKSTLKKIILKNGYLLNLYNKRKQNKEEKELNKRNTAIKKHGEECLILLQDLLKNTNRMYFFDMGTLLGLIREGHLLSHDYDLDVAIFISDQNDVLNVRNILKGKKCVHLYEFTVENLGVVEDSFKFKNIKFDINYYTRDEDKDYCYLLYRDGSKNYFDNSFDVVRLSCSKIKFIDCYNLNGNELNIPCEAEEYLEIRYGKDWKIPNPNWEYYEGPSAQKVNNRGYMRVINNY